MSCFVTELSVDVMPDYSGHIRGNQSVRINLSIVSNDYAGLSLLDLSKAVEDAINNLEATKNVEKIAPVIDTKDTKDIKDERMKIFSIVGYIDV